MTAPSAPLAGVRVIDLTQALAGPYCTMLLGDQGAEVIKIERPGVGDDTRQQSNPMVGNENSAFLAVNRNKKSVVVDLRQPLGAEVVRRMVASADVFVENFRPGKADELGLGWEDLHRLNPRLIYCSISGWGADGPEARRAGYATTAEAFGGVMSLTGDPDRPPVRIGVSIVDNLAGLFAKDAITAALLARECSGAGQRVDTSLLESTVAILSMTAYAYLAAGVVPGRTGSEHQWNVPWKVFRTQDGFIVIASSSENQWHRICQAIDRPQLATDPRFATMPLRHQHRTELYAILDEIMLGGTSEDWLRRLSEAGAAAAPVNNVAQVFNEPQVLHRQMLQHVRHATLGQIAQVGHPQKFSGTPSTIRLPPPVLGQHTREVLRDLAGCTETELNELHAPG